MEPLPGYDEWKTRAPEDDNPYSTEEPEPCEVCGGSGEVPIGEHFVTRDMAIDGGCPEMEGASMGIEYGRCPECGGSGERQP